MDPPNFSELIFYNIDNAVRLEFASTTIESQLHSLTLTPPDLPHGILLESFQMYQVSLSFSKYSPLYSLWFGNFFRHFLAISLDVQLLRGVLPLDHHL